MNLEDSNNKFRMYATSTAFRVSLSKAMVQLLLTIAYRERAEKSPLRYLDANIATTSALIDRGLAYVAVLKGDSAWATVLGLTEAGKLLVPLVEMAGLESEEETFDKWEAEYGEPVEEIPDLVIKAA